MPIASASRLLARRPGNQNDSGAIWALARTFPENCMTLHDAEARPNLHFLSSPATLGESQKSLVFPHILPMKTGLWLGAESNRRHVDFQSTALPTELPSRKRRGLPPRGIFTMQQCDCRARPRRAHLTNKNPVMLSGAKHLSSEIIRDSSLRSE